MLRFPWMGWFSGCLTRLRVCFQAALGCEVLIGGWRANVFSGCLCGLR
ncbi:hypothetical protein GCWU000324_00682 [Kingella oralis ATCC 51147]|uniref:Uncharacterized protein n=1 Tax=Kingella oralis ATCC 51147 TaxID=629741 RepID=C4GEX2_9NEIS|nr:hypothetical protein GCWU000324_00682 [Kingella oralis ATCC 51147]